MTKVTITGLVRRRRPMPNEDGSIVLAYFNADLGGLTLKGCGFMRRRDNTLAVFPPAISAGGERRAVLITDPTLREAMLVAAQAAYRALGGTDGEDAA